MGLIIWHPSLNIVSVDQNKLLMLNIRICLKQDTILCFFTWVGNFGGFNPENLLLPTLIHSGLCCRETISSLQTRDTLCRRACCCWPQYYLCACGCIIHRLYTVTSLHGIKAALQNFISFLQSMLILFVWRDHTFGLFVFKLT